MIATRAQAIVAALVASLVIAGVARAQSPGVYVPSTHDPGCRGLICADPIDPSHPPPPPPPCEGLICGLTPYGMERPYTAAEAAQAERARAEAQAAAARPAMPEPTKKKRRKAKVHAAKAAAPRTAAPAEPGADAAK